MKQRIFFWLLPFAIAVWGIPCAAFAQKVTLDTVHISGHTDPVSEIHGRMLEKQSTQLMHVISRQSIEQAADITVADILQRVSGVSLLQNETGIPGHVIIRGMAPKYSYTAVNGMAIPSPDERTRYLSLDFFPSAIIDHLEIYKTLSPAMAGDATGGHINIVTRTAPAQQELSFQVATGYNQFYLQQAYTGFDKKAVQRQSPYELFGPDYNAAGNDFSKGNLSFHRHTAAPDLQGNVSWGKRFASGKLGIFATTGMQTIHSGADGFLVLQNNEPQVNNVPGITDFIKRTYYQTSNRKYFYTTLDYRFNPKHHLRLYQLYLDKADMETRNAVDTSLAEGRTGPGTGRIAVMQRERTTRQSLEHLDLQGDHLLAKGLTLDWAGVHSIARGNAPDRAELTANTGRILGADGQVHQTPLLLAPLERTWMHNKEWENDLHADLHFKPALPKQPLDLEAGTLLQYRRRDNFFNDYLFNPAITSGNGQPFTGIYDAVWLNDNGPQNPRGSVNTAGTYTAKENISAFFLQATYHTGKLNAVAGMREASTVQHVHSAASPGASRYNEIAIRYRDWLPSVSARYALNEVQALKLSWYRSLSRPSLYDITFFNMNYDDYNIAGNPFLKRSTAHNFDLRYELYHPGILELLQVTAFYKRIADPYERTLLGAMDTLYPIPANGLSYIPAARLTEQLRNYATANNYGLELAVVKQWGAFGIQANYTFTASHITQTKKYKQREKPDDPASGIVTVTRTQERPLEGQSAHLGNLGLNWHSAQHGWQMQLQGVYTGRRIAEISGWYNLDNWQRAYTTLDLTVQKTIGGHWHLFAKATNLLNAGTEIYIKGALPGVPGQTFPGRTILERSAHERGFQVGVQFSRR